MKNVIVTLVAVMALSVAACRDTHPSSPPPVDTVTSVEQKLKMLRNHAENGKRDYLLIQKKADDAKTNKPL